MTAKGGTDSVSPATAITFLIVLMYVCMYEVQT